MAACLPPWRYGLDENCVDLYWIFWIITLLRIQSWETGADPELPGAAWKNWNLKSGEGSLEAKLIFEALPIDLQESQSSQVYILHIRSAA